MKITALQIGSFFGLIAVALGAIGAHYVSPENGFDIKISDAWETAALYQLLHALALILTYSICPHKKWVTTMFTLGVVLFSGSIYLYTFTNWKFLMMLTPIGGICLICGWLILFFHSISNKKKPS
jgi:uncharacterized membrane protein YgdD (TMEM256/DUF423 family)